MAFRGRGRGRGGPNNYAKQEPFVIFPDIKLPEKSIMIKEHDRRNNDEIIYTTREKPLVAGNYKLQKFWSFSAYFLEDGSEKGQSRDIERYSDRGKSRNKLERDSLDAFMICNSFPPELHDVLIGKKGSKRRTGKRVRWNPDSDLQKLDLFEKLEQANRTDGVQDEDEDETGKKKKKGDNEDENGEDGVEEEKEDSEYSDDGDYNQNEYFDDDEDDFNIEDDGGNDEGEY